MIRLDPAAKHQGTSSNISPVSSASSFKILADVGSAWLDDRGPNDAQDDDEDFADDPIAKIDMAVCVSSVVPSVPCLKPGAHL